MLLTCIGAVNFCGVAGECASQMGDAHAILAGNMKEQKTRSVHILWWEFVLVGL